MKTTLNKILYKLADNELNNSVVNEQGDRNLWQKIKDKLSIKKPDFDENPVNTQHGTTINNEPTAVGFRLVAPLANADINSNFGWRGGKRHRGVDFAVPVGSPVYAVRPGIVERISDQASGWGKYIIIKHEPGTSYGETFYSLYAHLSNVSVTNRQAVTAGMVIGKSGGEDGAPGAGNSTGPHLHFEIQLSLLGNQVDPRKFYAKYKSKLENASVESYERMSSNTNVPSDSLSNNSLSFTPAGNNLNTIQSTSKISTYDIQPGVTTKYGFTLYNLPGDEKWVYGVPVQGSALKSGWWTLVPSTNSWVNLQDKLKSSDYIKATNLLNNQYPTALNVEDVPADNIDNTNTLDTDPVTDPEFKKLPIGSRFKPGAFYKPANMLKNKDVLLYILNKGTIKPEYDKSTGKALPRYTFKDKVNIKYLGHDKTNKFIHVHVYTYEPADKKKYYDYWFNIADVKL